jgi:chromosomal replication initiation ATPase DnaA
MNRLTEVYLLSGVIMYPDPKGYKKPKEKPKEPVYAPIALIAKIVCEVTGIPFELVRSKSRKREYTIPRHLISKIAYDHCPASTPQIGKYIDRAYSSVIWANGHVMDEIRTDKQYKALYMDIMDKLQQITGELDVYVRQGSDLD